MAQLAIETMEPDVTEILPAIDRAHLARMTFGDRSLEQEVLQLFDRQSALLIERMRNGKGLGDGAVVGALAHTLKGSAAGIGAKSVARAAEATERAAAQTGADAPADLGATIDRLAAAVEEARLLIGTLLRGGMN